jgi:hypothetical protein
MQDWQHRTKRPAVCGIFLITEFITLENPDKLRVVFGCSARFKDQSLNKHLLTGSDLTNGPAGVLCRFRQHPIAIMFGIEKIFHQIIVKKVDRDFLRFFGGKTET